MPVHVLLYASNTTSVVPNNNMTYCQGLHYGGNAQLELITCKELHVSTSNQN